MLEELYQAVIIDHGRHPRNQGVDPEATARQEGFNPLCGDRLVLYLVVREGCIERVCFEGEGCAISMASASLMTEAIKGKSLEQVTTLFATMHSVLVGKPALPTAEPLGKLAALGGVAAYPSRIKCATLPWHTLLSALRHEPHPVSTDDAS